MKGLWLQSAHNRQHADALQLYQWQSDVLRLVLAELEMSTSSGSNFCSNDQSGHISYMMFRITLELSFSLSQLHITLHCKWNSFTDLLPWMYFKFFPHFFIFRQLALERESRAFGFHASKCRTEWGWWAVPQCASYRDPAASHSFLETKQWPWNTWLGWPEGTEEQSWKSQQPCWNVKIYQDCSPWHADRQKRQQHRRLSRRGPSQPLWATQIKGEWSKPSCQALRSLIEI